VFCSSLLYQSLETDIAGIISDIANTHHVEIKLVWIPSHVGIEGNETADRLAKSATNNQTADITINSTKSEINDKIDSLILTKWQQQYDRSPTGRTYKLLEPKVSLKIKYADVNRQREKTITRLRLGKCCLNQYLHKINRHPTGHCDHCKKPETVEHFLLQCPHAAIFKDTEIKNIKEALNSEKNIDKIYSRIREIKKRI